MRVDSASRGIHNAHIISNLHSRARRIPCVKRAVDFRAFEQAGRDLAKLHVNYESVKPYRLKMESTGKLTGADYRVEKMRYGKDQAKDKDKTTLQYNESITLIGIPLEAYEYVVNGKPALDWVVERQGVSTHKESGIVNDANDWAKETMKDPQYPLDLFCRVVTVSLDTMKIVNSLPKLDI
jgi:predicted helicase